ncbi:hypothetical protein ZIOFF_019074 [Zingiber officinale]|uniref:Uncharacterized protein n=1 Tax=Zingiber officinale TaxID=94328 RepID=A0A8J5LSL9_ZINOF|nr:hypothetical protein ZIOFF_019074 [Zingiber officinale]
MTAGWKEIIRLGETRFATTFIALKSLHDHKDSLQALVTSGDYKKFLKIDKGKEVKQIVLDEKFWNNCLITVRIMGPLIRLLRVCDTDERPSLGYVYEGMSEQLKRSYDPVDYESIDKTDFWVVEETLIGELDYDELEEELEELPIPLESSNFQQFEDDGDEAEPEDVNLDLFQRRSVLVDEDDWI